MKYLFFVSVVLLVLSCDTKQYSSEAWKPMEKKVLRWEFNNHRTKESTQYYWMEDGKVWWYVALLQDSIIVDGSPHTNAFQSHDALSGWKYIEDYIVRDSLILFGNDPTHFWGVSNEYNFEVADSIMGLDTLITAKIFSKSVREPFAFYIEHHP